MRVNFNKPYNTGDELRYIAEAIRSGRTSGDGPFTKKCTQILTAEFGFKNPLLTTSCTDALEICAMLLDIVPGDEVIVPAYTFVSTALAFARQGATIVFADSRKDNPCIDEDRLKDLVTAKTKAVVPVHYAGIPCNMEKIMKTAADYNLWVVEDAAHGFGSWYKGKPLGTIGHLGCISFHETKVVHCGEGGALSVNNERFVERASVLWEKGTNRVDFHKGNVKKYEWVDTGSSFLMSDLSAAFLYAQLKKTGEILQCRKSQWDLYFDSLKELQEAGYLKLPICNELSWNHSVFFLVTNSTEEKDQLISYLGNEGIQALSHYLDLELSPYIRKNQPSLIRGEHELNSLKFQDRLVRLPLYYDLTESEIEWITDVIKKFFKKI